jgi:hypothetical protein
MAGSSGGGKLWRSKGLDEVKGSGGSIVKLWRRQEALEVKGLEAVEAAGSSRGSSKL